MFGLSDHTNIRNVAQGGERFKYQQINRFDPGAEGGIDWIW
jgi:hypothetical protein